MSEQERQLARLGDIISLLRDLRSVLSDHRDEGVTVDGFFERFSAQARAIKTRLEVEFENHPLRNQILSSLEGVADQFHPKHLDQIHHYIMHFEKERYRLRHAMGRAQLRARVRARMNAAEANARVARATVAARADAASNEIEEKQGDDETS